MHPSAGIPCTARIRTPLTEIAALKALLSIFRAAALSWSYRPLRSVLDHPYFAIGIDLRSIDYLSQSRRVEGLDAWQEYLGRLATEVEETEQRFRGKGLFADRLQKDVDAFMRERQTPIVEGSSVTFVWRGRAREVTDATHRMFEEHDLYRLLGTIRYPGGVHAT